jgi:hypothetical protein
MGTPAVMKASDVAALPVEWGAALRRGRLFHPEGILAEGRLERIAPPGRGLPMTSGPIVGRLSKGIGLPGSLPDIGGLAWRMSSGADDAFSWDLLLASTAHGPLGRVLLRPITSWSNAQFSTLVPLEYQGRAWWLRARIATPIEERGLALDVLARHIAADGLDLEIDQAAGVEEFEALARLSLRHVRAPGDVSFDPVLHEAPGVRLLPGWLSSLRRVAYQRSRRGRSAE